MSKLEKIKTSVVEGYDAVEQTVTSSYKKVEDTVVNGYKKIEDKFVDTFLKKDNETIEEAKERIKNEQNNLKNQNIKTTEEIQDEIKKKYNL